MGFFTTRAILHQQIFRPFRTRRPSAGLLSESQRASHSRCYVPSHSAPASIRSDECVGEVNLRNKAAIFAPDYKTSSCFSYLTPVDKLKGCQGRVWSIMHIDSDMQLGVGFFETTCLYLSEQFAGRSSSTIKC